MTSSSRGYIAIVRTPRIPANLLAGVSVRLGCGIIPFSTVVAFADPYGFTYSGLATAGFMLSMSLLGPWRGRMFDRYGPRTLTAGALAYALLITAAALSVGQATPWLPIALLTAAGPVMPPINATLRTRWSRLLPDKQDLQQVHALDSIVEEITFLFSPILITAALSVVPARACIMLGGVIPLLSLVLLHLGRPDPASSPTTTADAHPATGRSQRTTSLIRTTAGLGIVAPIAALGLVGGSLGVLLPAAEADAGHISSAGYLLAGFSLGGVIGGYLYGKRTWTSPLRHHYVIAGIVLTATAAVVGASIHTPLRWIAVPAAGLAMTPLFVIAYLLVDQLLSHRQTEANSWINSGYNFGSVGGAAGAGALLSHTSPAIITLGVAAVALLSVACALRLPLPSPPASRMPAQQRHEIGAETDA
ncbi:MFS transporter [Streptomyces sp. NBC_01334]|uniref:MFS transporter n=1 Tax=Streptomyces sp. NBC_01334 TaxID=2903827 RepID=UPI002E0E38DD|nr:hypothetical protein OG736_45620 [Streptomyces sp. NBC_01334]